MHEHVIGGPDRLPLGAIRSRWHGQPHITLHSQHSDRGCPADADAYADVLRAARNIPSAPNLSEHDDSYDWARGHEPVDRDIAQPLNATCVACMVLLMLVGLAVGALQMI